MVKNFKTFDDIKISDETKELICPCMKKWCMIVYKTYISFQIISNYQPNQWNPNFD
jgi:hypothetical protein